MASIVPSSSKDCFKSGAQGSCRWSTADVGLTFSIRVNAPEDLILQHPASDTTGTVSVISARLGGDAAVESHCFTYFAKRLTQLTMKADNDDSFSNIAYELRPLCYRKPKTPNQSRLHSMPAKPKVLRRRSTCRPSTSSRHIVRLRSSKR